MLPKVKNFNIYPSVLPVRKTCRMTVIPTERVYLLSEDKEYKITVIPRNGDEPFYYTPIAFDEFPVKAENGIITFDFAFDEEQEYLIHLTHDTKVIGVFNVYALEEDLYSLKALKGDLHAHSHRSDGARDPAALMGHFREQGYDFLALTDHNRYFTGEEMEDAYKGVCLGITRVKGEEVHTPGSTVHIVHVGGEESVASKYIEDRDGYEKAWREYLKKVPENIPEQYAERYAKIMWASDCIHNAGGLAIFPHPYWMPKGRPHNVKDEFAAILLKSGMFDAFELIGGASVIGNNRNVALLSEIQREGCDISVVGSSDVHEIESSPVFPHYFTVCFAKENSNDAILEAVKSGLSVAVEAQGNEYERVHRAYGKLRLVSYAQFLLTHYFPERARMCAGEGIVMRSYLMGYASESLIESLVEFNAQFTDRFFGRLAPILPSCEILEYEEKWRQVQIEKGPITCGGNVDSDTVTRKV